MTGNTPRSSDATVVKDITTSRMGAPTQAGKMPAGGLVTQRTGPESVRPPLGA